jgi:hypothetical protein
MPRGQGKGSEFERLLCEKLAVWWTGDAGVDPIEYCWRSSQSGGRSTQRAKKGKKAAGHSGDIVATSNAMKPFFKLFTVEAKNGYHSYSGFQLLDRPKGMKGLQGIEKFIVQARSAMKRSGTPYWMLVHRRTGREIMTYTPRAFWEKADVPPLDVPTPFAEFFVQVNGVNRWMVCTPLDKFLELIDRKQIIRIYKERVA